LHHAARLALLIFTSVIVWGVSFWLHETGFQKSHSLIPPVPVVLEQPASSNVTAHSVISLNRISRPPLAFLRLFALNSFFAFSPSFKVGGEEDGERRPDSREPTPNGREDPS